MQYALLSSTNVYHIIPMPKACMCITVLPSHLQNSMKTLGGNFGGEFTITWQGKQKVNILSYISICFAVNTGCMCVCRLTVEGS